MAGAVPHPGGHLPDVQRRGRLGDGQAVYRHQFQHGTFASREGLQFRVQLPDLPQRVDFRHHAFDVVGIEQPASRDHALRTVLASGAAELGGDDIARDPVQPRPRAAGGPR